MTWIDRVRVSLVLIAVAFPAWPTHGQEGQASPAVADLGQAALRERVLATAQRYATFEWTATEANVHHGDDSDGVRIDTPDATFDERGFRTDGTPNHGMPYAWGGFSSIEEFKQGLDAGLYAGLVPVSERAGASRHAVGLDCSGFVARCWELPVKQSTRSLGRLCYPLKSCVELRPGDILNKFDSHVVLFKEWVDEERTTMRVVEAARLAVEENEYTVEYFVSRGFEPMRFMPLDDRWVSMKTAEADYSSDGASARGTFTLAAPDAAPDNTSVHPWQDTEAGEWARYRVTDTFAAMPSAYSLLRFAAAIRDDAVLAQCMVDVDGEQLPSGSQLSRDASVADALVDFAAFETPLHNLKLERSDASAGRYDWGERTFAAQRRSLEFTGDYIVRHQSFPLRLTIDCVTSEDVPLHGVLQADVVMEITFEGQGVYTRSKAFSLAACAK